MNWRDVTLGQLVDAIRSRSATVKGKLEYDRGKLNIEWSVLSGSLLDQVAGQLRKPAERGPLARELHIEAGVDDVVRFLAAWIEEELPVSYELPKTAYKEPNGDKENTDEG